MNLQTIELGLEEVHMSYIFSGTVVEREVYHQRTKSTPRDD